MYSSAHYLIFINYEDFFSAIAAQTAALANQEVFFFSGYDGDSLAYEPISRFVQTALPFFAKHPKAILELRTKSTQITELLRTPPLANCVVAFSLSPASIVARYELKTPSLAKRLNAMRRLVQHGWQLGIRLDPLMWEKDWRNSYLELTKQLAAAIPNQALHSITLGTLRFPRNMYDNMTRLYPTAPFLIDKLIVSDKQAQLQRELAASMMASCQTQLKRHYDAGKIFCMLKEANQL